VHGEVGCAATRMRARMYRGLGELEMWLCKGRSVFVYGCFSVVVLMMDNCHSRSIYARMVLLQRRLCGLWSLMSDRRL
jgi:hypothetical protein